MGTIKLPTIALGKDVIRSDFAPNDFDKEVRAYGYRLMWQAGEDCPCRGSTATENPDSSCKACWGTGFCYVHPCPSAPNIAEYATSAPPFCDTTTSRATQAIITSMTRDTEMFDKYGQWILGTARLTTFSFNEVAFRDRFTLYDSTMVYKQVLKLGSSKLIPVGRHKDQLRYPVVKMLRVFTVNTKTGAITDHTSTSSVADDGSIDMTLSTAGAGSLVSLRYTMHPVWVVMDHPYATRDTLTKKKEAGSPLGKYLKLPVHCLAKLDFLVDPPAGG